MISHGLILAAGRGTRLGPDNQGRPKCLAQVGIKSIIDWQLEALSQCSVSRVTVVTGFEAEQVIHHLRTHEWEKRLALDFVYNERFASTNVLSSWNLAAARLTDSYVYLHGDTVFEPALLHRLIGEADSVQPALAVDRHPCGDEEMKVVTKGTNIVRISKELDPGVVVGEFTGIMVVPLAAHRVLSAQAADMLREEGADRLFVEASVQACIDAGSLAPKMVDITGARWREIDFPEDLLAARQLLGSAE